ncbi:MAG: glycosyltransferase [Verrucomicrobiales bacterium]
MPQPILLVIPAYHESGRLPNFLPELCEAVAGSGLMMDILVVDDGSGAAEQDRLEEWLGSLRERHPFLAPMHRLPVNQGKGGAVYAGWELATHHHWLAFVDADGAVPPAEVIRVARLTNDPNLMDKAIFAVRVSGAGRTVKRTISRRITGLVFRWLVRLLFDVPVPDTQCGYKIVPAPAYRSVRSHLVEKRFCFDVELGSLLTRSGCRIVAVPIDWHESPGGKVHPWAVREMFTSLMRLRRRLTPAQMNAGG